MMMMMGRMEGLIACVWKVKREWGVKMKMANVIEWTDVLSAVKLIEEGARKKENDEYALRDSTYARGFFEQLL